jgi:hypothetical protein
MTNRFFILILFSFFLSQNAGAQNFAWARQTGTANSSPYSSVVAIDNVGCVYTSGAFSGTVDFDPGPNVFNLTGFGYKAFFVSKFDNNGNFIWAKQISATNSSAISQSIAVDGSGNIYTTGYFFGSPDFDPGANVFTLTSVTINSDIFVCKLDSSGNFLWADQFGGVGFEIGNSVTTDIYNDVYFTGYFSGTCDFNPGPGVANLVPVGGSNSFACKLDPAGNLTWIKQLGRGTVTVNGSTRGFGIAVDMYRNVYTTGTFSDTADFDPDTTRYNLITSSGPNFDIYLSKLDSAGNFVYAKQLSGLYASDEAHGIAVDGLQNVYITGNYGDTVDFDPGAGVYNLISQGANDIFIAKYTAVGNFVWAKTMGGLYNDFGVSIALDYNEEIYTTGNFGGPADFDPGSATFTMTPAGNADVFISKLNSSANFMYARQVGGPNNDYSYSIAADFAGNVYVGGDFFGNADFDPGVGTYNLNAAAGYDVFTLKLQTGSVDVGQIVALPFSVNIFSDAMHEQFKVESPAIIEELIITNAAGQVIYNNHCNSKSFSFRLKAGGIYFVQVKAGTEWAVQKITAW